jgi:hypothetical protein
MKTLKIDCKGIKDLACYGHNGYVQIELQNVDYSFLEEIDSELIVGSHNANDLMDAIGYDAICDYLESNFDVEKIREIR